MQTIEENMKNITPNQENQENQEENKMNTQATETIETDQNGNVRVEPNVFQKEFDNPAEAMQVVEALDQLGYGDNYALSMNKQKAVVILKGLDAKKMDTLQRKIRINNWSSRTVAIADTVTNFATDIANYALNGALAPAVGSVANAGITTARVVGTATIKAGAMVATSALKNGRLAAYEIRHSKEVSDCWTEVKKCGQDIASVLFGSEPSNSTGNGWTAVTR